MLTWELCNHAFDPFQHAGVIQPTKEIGKMCRERKIFFHTDAAQAVGKIPINVNDHNIDLMSISGHKIYGPKGVGAIYIRRRPRVRLEAQMNGGGQVCTQPSPCCISMLSLGQDWPKLYQIVLSIQPCKRFLRKADLVKPTSGLKCIIGCQIVGMCVLTLVIISIQLGMPILAVHSASMTSKLSR